MSDSEQGEFEEVDDKEELEKRNPNLVNLCPNVAQNSIFGSTF